MRIVYVDELFLLNFAVDYIILYITAHFSSLPFKQWRLAASAVFGAFYAAGEYICELNGIAFAALPPVKLAIGLLIVLCAFGFTSGGAFARRTVVFYITSILLGGSVYALGVLLGIDMTAGAIAAPAAVRAVVIVSALALGLCGMFSHGGAAVAASAVELRLTLGERSTQFRALCDSGNLLRDPLDGSPVVVAELDALVPLFDSETLGVLRHTSAVEAVAALGGQGGWRLIPCTTAAGQALLAAFRPTTAYSGDRALRVMVAITAEKLGTIPAIVGDITGAGISRKESSPYETFKKAS